MMDHSIKKKPEKAHMLKIKMEKDEWACICSRLAVFAPTAAEAYQEWQRTRAALNEHEGKQ